MVRNWNGLEKLWMPHPRKYSTRLDEALGNQTYGVASLPTVGQLELDDL